MGSWRIPTIVRAVVLGAATFYFVQLGQLILLLNTSVAPLVPWAVALSVVFLWACWVYLSGAGWPSSTRDTRRRSMRVHQADGELRRLGYLCTVPILLCITGIAIVSSSLIQFPPESFATPDFLTELEPYMGFLIVFGYSLVAGVSEEIGFRGYMQVPLEERYGPSIAIAITSVVFWLAHADHASFLHRTALLLGAGYLAGYVSYYGRSLVPAVIVHTAADTIGFTTAAGLFGLEPIYTPTTIWETGVTPIFAASLVLMIGGGWWSVRILKQMARLRR